MSSADQRRAARSHLFADSSDEDTERLSDTWAAQQQEDDDDVSAAAAAAAHPWRTLDLDTAAPAIPAAILALGCIIGLALPGVLSSPPCTAAVFVCLHHFLEYLVTLRTSPARASFAALMFNPDGDGMYLLALALSAAECWLIPPLVFPSKLAFDAASAAGLLLVLCGQGLRTAAMLTAAGSFDHYIREVHVAEHELVTTGVYAFSRHPSYLGFLAYAVGIQLLLGNTVCLVANVVVLHRFFRERIAYEEHTLVRFFGRRYLEYKQQVPTRIPFLSEF